jgi:hypothetical protein
LFDFTGGLIGHARSFVCISTHIGIPSPGLSP